MLKFVSQIATAAAVAACASVSAQAMPMPAVDQIAAAAAPGAVQEVDWHGGWHGHGYYGGGGCYYGGCYHHHHNNYWVPLAAFGAGALVGALAVQPRYHSYYHQSGHYTWCQGEYGPYRCYVPDY